MTSADVTLDDGLGLLSELPTMTREEFASAKDEVDRRVLGPARQLVEEVGVVLQEQVSPTISAVPKVNGSISPLHRDLRFAEDRSTLYKDHLLINFWDGSPRRHAPTLRVRIAPDGIGLAAGAAFDPEGLRSWRNALCSPAVAELEQIVGALSTGWELRRSDPELARLPRGLEPRGELAEALCRHRTIQYRVIEAPPGPLGAADFDAWVAARLIRFGDLHRWFVEALR